ncbi:MAG: threonine synthase [Candidatus Sericytochromatia bacterium]|nr:MAG: threonine synthase [Candidatus Sericytochromatia bacterium]
MYQWKGLIQEFKEYLPVSNKTPIVTLNEGNTPLIYSNNLSSIVGANIYLKYEGLNPTCSFKDRGMTLAISKAIENNSKAVICASTGNTSASMAAYSAKANIKSFLLVPDGYVALGKLSQAIIHGSEVIKIKGNFDKALELVIEISNKYPVTLVNSINPYRIEGQKTSAFEICIQLGDAPDILSIPVGNAGNITAYWKGFKEYKDKNNIDKLPKMFGFQAEGAAPIVKKQKIENPQTIATAIRIGNPASWEYANKALEESNGYINIVSDKEILEAYKFLAKNEGIFCEPASAISVAGILKYYKNFDIKKDFNIVCVLTGHGLKDPDNAISQSSQIKEAIEPNLDMILERIMS